VLGIAIWSLLLGMVTGLLAGLFGIGGGLVIVPVLIFLFTEKEFPAHVTMIMAIATSLAAIIITALASVYAHHRLGSVRWYKVIRLAPGIMAGAGLGAWVANRIPVEQLRLIFISFLIYVGIEMARAKPLKTGNTEYTRLIDGVVSCIIGLISALVGIGGGTLTVPYLVHSNFPMRNAVAVAGACGLPIAIGGTFSYALLGLQVTNLPEGSLGYVYLPAFSGIALGSLFTAPLGAKLANKLPAKQLKRYFSLLIFAIAISLIRH
jgi:uncharacterized protein